MHNHIENHGEVDYQISYKKTLKLTLEEWHDRDGHGSRGVVHRPCLQKMKRIRYGNYWRELYGNIYTYRKGKLSRIEHSNFSLNGTTRL
ncbi:hypothetical protein VNO80_04295 [Phaseolus coccineus]|uniref:Uncharacterized protein n=1 Tax=Phaseolus coccineus TaxID=3886 RepID=A0AAN9NXM0_PHACN